MTVVRSHSPSSFSHSKPMLVSVDRSSQPWGTSKTVPKRGLTTAVHPAMVGCSPLLPSRGLAGFSLGSFSAGSPDFSAEAAGVGLPSASSFLPSSPPKTTKPVTAVATTTAVAATMATIVVFLRSSPGGLAPTVTVGAPHWPC